jgi:hypothetical protein
MSRYRPLREHIKAVHDKKCNFWCAGKFLDIVPWREHIKAVHDEKCNFCESEMSRYRLLLRVMAVYAKKCNIWCAVKCLDIVIHASV